MQQTNTEMGQFSTVLVIKMFTLKQVEYFNFFTPKSATNLEGNIQCWEEVARQEFSCDIVRN